MTVGTSGLMAALDRAFAGPENRADRLRLLPPDLRVTTGPVDCAQWNDRLVLGAIMRRRFSMILGLLPTRVGRLLEVGYGSGVFLPSLAGRAETLIGVDVHPHADAVGAALGRIGVEAQLVTASAESIPLDDDSVDAVVGVSCLEFIPDLDRAAQEFDRVCRPTGVIVVVCPEQSRALDAGLRLLTGRSAERDFQGRRERVIPTLCRHLDVDRTLAWPPPPLPPLYAALRMRPRR